jgi:hypothetical protein
MKTKEDRFRIVCLVCLWIGLVLTPLTGQCFYNPNSGRWLSRDPNNSHGSAPQFIADQALPKSADHVRSSGEDPYTFSVNDPIDAVDILGLVKWTPNHKVGDIRIPSHGGGEWVHADVLEGATDKGRAIQFWKSGTGDYWCHGFTFDGSIALEGPFSPFGVGDPWGDSVSKILEDDGWVHTCCGMAKTKDIVVFYSSGKIVHSAKVMTVDSRDGEFNEYGSWVVAKDDSYGPLRFFTFAQESQEYEANYKCFSKPPHLVGCCPMKGEHEIPPSAP